MMSIYLFAITLIAHLSLSIAEETQVNLKSKSGDTNYISINTINSTQIPSIYIKAFPLIDSDCYCSYNQSINLLLCSPYLQNSSSFSLSSSNLSLINITLNDCIFFNNHFNLPKIQNKTIDYLRLNDINHQDYLLFDKTSFTFHSINHLYIIYTYIQPITMLLFSNETFSSSSIALSLRTLYIDSCYLITLYQPFTHLVSLESITLINIHEFSWYDFQQQIIHLPQLRSIYIGDKILSTTNDIFNVLSCQDLSSQWTFTYRLVQTCSCQLISFLTTIQLVGDSYQCPNSNRTIDFIDNICQYYGKEYPIRNSTNNFCNQCLSKQCSNGTLCGESYDSESHCLLLSRYDYETIRNRIPLTPYTKQYLFRETRDYLTMNQNQTLEPNAFNSFASILINSNQNLTQTSPIEVQMFHQTFAAMLSRPWSPQIYSSSLSKPTTSQELIMSLDQSIKNINDGNNTFEFQSKLISTISLPFPTNQPLPNMFGWQITEDNFITANITHSRPSNPNITARVFLEFKRGQSYTMNCNNSNNCSNRFSITSLKSPKLFYSTNRIPEYDVISIIAPNSNQQVKFYFEQKIPLADRFNYSTNTTNTTSTSDPFYDQLNPMVSQGVCMYLDTDNMTWVTDGCTTDRLLSNSTSVVCTCEHLTMFTVFFSLTCATPSQALEILSWIGCGLSILGLSVTLIVFVVISQCQRAKYSTNGASSTESSSSQELRRKLTNKPRRLSMVKSMLFVLGILLILMNILIFILTFTKSGRNLACSILSALLYYFTLTAFIWKLFFAFQQSLFITNIFRTYWSNRTLFIIYLIITFSLPVCPLIIMFIKYENFTFISSTCNYCWLTREFLLYGLIIPILVILCLNILFYFYTMIHLCLKNRQQPGLRSTKSDHSRNIQNFKIGLFFAIIMGFSWIFGFLVLIPNSYVQLVGNILFCVINSIQGFAFSIMVFCMLEKKSFRKCFCFWRSKYRMKKTFNSQNIQPQQLNTASNDDNELNIKNIYNPSIYTSSTSNGENNNHEGFDQNRNQRLSTRTEEEDEYVYSTLPL